MHTFALGLVQSIATVGADRAKLLISLIHSIINIADELTGSRAAASKLSIFDTIAKEVCQQCYDSDNDHKIGALSIIALLIENMPKEWLAGHALAMIKVYNILFSLF